MLAQVALTPFGKPLTPVSSPLLATPVAPVVSWVIELSVVLIQSVSELDAAETVHVELFVIVIFKSDTAAFEPSSIL